MLINVTVNVTFAYLFNGKCLKPYLDCIFKETFPNSHKISVKGKRTSAPGWFQLYFSFNQLLLKFYHNSCNCVYTNGENVLEENPKVLEDVIEATLPPTPINAFNMLTSWARFYLYPTVSEFPLNRNCLALARPLSHALMSMSSALWMTLSDSTGQVIACSRRMTASVGWRWSHHPSELLWLNYCGRVVR